MKPIIKEKKLDEAVRGTVRRRDGRCVFPLRTPEDYHNGSLQVSHFHGRTARSTRWDLDNIDLICGRHHQFLEERKQAEYRDWKLKQLGTRRFNALNKRYYLTHKFSEPEKAEILNENPRRND